MQSDNSYSRSFPESPAANAAAMTLKESGLTYGDAMGLLVLNSPTEMKVDKSCSEYRAFGDVWRAGVNAAGAPAGTGFHQLRHFYASLLIRHGESVKTVQARLGHVSASETLDTYSHLWPDRDDRTRTAVDFVFFRVVRAGEVVDGHNPQPDADWRTSRSISRILSRPLPTRGDHPSATAVTSGLVRSTRRLGRAALKCLRRRVYASF